MIIQDIWPNQQQFMDPYLHTISSLFSTFPDPLLFHWLSVKKHLYNDYLSYYLCDNYGPICKYSSLILIWMSCYLDYGRRKDYLSWIFGGLASQRYLCWILFQWNGVLCSFILCFESISSSSFVGRCEEILFRSMNLLLVFLLSLEHEYFDFM